MSEICDCINLLSWDERPSNYCCTIKMLTWKTNHLASTHKIVGFTDKGRLYFSLERGSNLIEAIQLRKENQTWIRREKGNNFHLFWITEKSFRTDKKN